MKKVIFFTLVVGLLVALSAGLAQAGENIPSAKTAASSSSIIEMGPQEEGWTSVISIQIKTAESKELIIAFTAHSVVVTNVDVSDWGPFEFRVWLAMINVRAWIDAEYDQDGNVIGGIMARPGIVTLNNRSISLFGMLGELSPDIWPLISERAGSTNGFNFIATNIGPGVHTITVEASRIGTYPVDHGDYLALMGKRTLVVEEVRMAKMIPPEVSTEFYVFDNGVPSENVTFNGYAWLGDYKEADVYFEYARVQSLGVPPIDPIWSTPPHKITSTGFFSQFVTLPHPPQPFHGYSFYYRAVLVYNGIEIRGTWTYIFPPP